MFSHVFDASSILTEVMNRPLDLVDESRLFFFLLLHTRSTQELGKVFGEYLIESLTRSSSNSMKRV